MPNWMSEKEKEIFVLQEQNKFLTTSLKDLLAVIHRDGGHYTEEYGLEKSATDAQFIFYAKLKFEDDIKYHISKPIKIIEDAGRGNS